MTSNDYQNIKIIYNALHSRYFTGTSFNFICTVHSIFYVQYIPNFDYLLTRETYTKKITYN